MLVSCLCKLAVCVYMYMCSYVHSWSQNIFINRKKKLFSCPCHLHPIYLLVSRCVSGSFRQETEPGDSSAWWGSKANASGKI